MPADELGSVAAVTRTQAIYSSAAVALGASLIFHPAAVLVAAVALFAARDLSTLRARDFSSVERRLAVVALALGGVALTIGMAAAVHRGNYWSVVAGTGGAIVIAAFARALVRDSHSRPQG